MIKHRDQFHVRIVPMKVIKMTRRRAIVSMVAFGCFHAAIASDGKSSAVRGREAQPIKISRDMRKALFTGIYNRRAERTKEGLNLFWLMEDVAAMDGKRLAEKQRTLTQEKIKQDQHIAYMEKNFGAQEVRRERLERAGVARALACVEQELQDRRDEAAISMMPIADDE
jgi:hypothetical protein